MLFKPFPADLLPRGFVYPSELLEHPVPSPYYPWEWIDPESQVGKLAWRVRKSSARNLVPFATVEDDRKDVACFNGDDSSGNPAVVILVVDGSGRGYAFHDFADWRASANAEAQRWRADFGDLR